METHTPSGRGGGGKTYYYGYIHSKWEGGKYIIMGVHVNSKWEGGKIISWKHTLQVGGVEGGELIILGTYF